MSSLAAQTVFTPEKYLALERKATVKSEYLNGEIREMPRVNFTHNLITVDIATELNIQSRERDWEVYMSNMRVKTSTKGAYFYPDVIACCGEPEFEDNVFDTLLNPILPRHSGFRTSCADMKMCCLLTPSDANSLCKTFIDVFQKSSHKKVGEIRNPARKIKSR